MNRFFLIFLLGFSSSVLAGTKLSIFPTHIYLWTEKKQDVIYLTNESTETVNLQIYAKSWDMDEKGQFIETETGDFVFFPRLTKIAPQEKKNIRVGYEGDFPALEKPYRVYIEELPALQQPDAPNNKTAMGIQTKLVLSVPLFVKPSETSPPPNLEIKHADLSSKKLRVSLFNPTNHNVLISNLNLHWLDEEKQSLGEQKIDIIQRLLPQRSFWLEIPVKSICCDQVYAAQLQFQVEGKAKPFILSTSISNRQCQ